MTICNEPAIGVVIDTMSHEHRNKDDTIRRCDLDFTHLVGPEGGPLTWCIHGKLDPDIGYCIHSGTTGAKGIRIGTPCDNPFLARRNLP